MVESRCGICCSACEAEAKYGVACAGCTHIDNPFWGECGVKACCEGNDLAHCGQCEAMPCDLLGSFAYDPKEGDGGQRIAQCRAWRAQED